MNPGKKTGADEVLAIGVLDLEPEGEVADVANSVPVEPSMRQVDTQSMGIEVDFAQLPEVRGNQLDTMMASTAAMVKEFRGASLDKLDNIQLYWMVRQKVLAQLLVDRNHKKVANLFTISSAVMMDPLFAPLSTSEDAKAKRDKASVVRNINDVWRDIMRELNKAA